jgi:hypothetical protein
MFVSIGILNTEVSVKRADVIKTTLVCVVIRHKGGSW